MTWQPVAALQEGDQQSARTTSTPGGWRSTGPRRRGSRPPAFACAPPGPSRRTGLPTQRWPYSHRGRDSGVRTRCEPATDDLFLPVCPDSFPVPDWFFEHPFVIRGRIREDGHDQGGVLFDPRPDVRIDNVADVLRSKFHHQVPSTTAPKVRGASWAECSRSA